MKKIDQRAKVMGQFFFSKQKAELLDLLSLEQKQLSSPVTIFTPNPEHLMITREKPSFATTLQQADIRIADGTWVVIASRILSLLGKSEPIAERIAGVELAADLLVLALAKKWKVLLVGGRGYHGQSVVTEQCKNSKFIIQNSEKNQSSHHERKTQNSKVPSSARNQSSPNGEAGLTTWTIEQVDLSGDTQRSTTNSAQVPHPIHWVEAYADAQNPTEAEESELKKIMRKLQPELIFVALGAPAQEEWILRHYQLLRANKVQIAMVVGGAFDMLTGQVQRAPLLYRKAGFEWAYRLWQEPWRWKRQLRLLRFLGELGREVVRRNRKQVYSDQGTVNS